MYEKWPNSNDITWYEDQLGNIMQSYKTSATCLTTTAYGLTNRTTLPLHQGEYHIEDAIKKVIFNGPATIVIWKDGTKTTVKCSEYDIYDAEKGLAMAICKYVFGNEGKFKRVFKKWLPKDEPDEMSGTPLGYLGDMIRKIFSPAEEDEI